MFKHLGEIKSFTSNCLKTQNTEEMGCGDCDPQHGVIFDDLPVVEEQADKTVTGRVSSAPLVPVLVKRAGADSDTPCPQAPNFRVKVTLSTGGKRKDQPHHQKPGGMPRTIFRCSCLPAGGDKHRDS